MIGSVAAAMGRTPAGGFALQSMVLPSMQTG